MTEHVVIAYEQSARMLHGTFTGAARPWYQQLLARWLGLPVLLRRGDFGKGPFQAPEFLRPSEAPPLAAELLARLEAAARELEANLPAASTARNVTVEHPVFGRVSLADLLRFLVVHTNHHRPQLCARSA